MLREVAICALVLGCHLIVAAHSDTGDDNYLRNQTSAEEFSSTRSLEGKSKADEEDEDQNDIEVPNDLQNQTSGEEFTRTQPEAVSSADEEDEIREDTGDDNYLRNQTSDEEFTRSREGKSKTDEEDEDQNVESFCSQPPDIDGFISPVLQEQKFSVGKIINYQCDFGYVSRSSSSLLSVCRIDKRSGRAEWTHPNTTCIPRSCGDPGYVVNGRRIGHLFTFPNNVKFECLEGYKLQGLKDRYCQANGEWSGRLPTCVPIRCRAPSSPKNGRVLYSSLDYGSELEYICDKGFNLQDHQLRICNENGIWSNSEPECTETKCKIPESPERGSVQLFDEPKVGSLAFYSCDEGTSLVGEDKSKCLESGDWTFGTPKCLRYCYVPAVQDGEFGRYQWKRGHGQRFISLQIGERVNHNDAVTMRCKDGYGPGNGITGTSKEVTCNDGTWPEPLLCHQMACNGNPPPVENASPRVSSRLHGKSIWYECDRGFEKTKTGNVVCKFGRWEGPTPACGDYRCNLKDLNYPGLQLPQEDFLYNRHYFSITCHKAYEKILEGSISCSAGKWIIPGGKKNPCRIKTCEGEPPILTNGKTLKFDRVVGSVVDYECDEDYVMVGHSSVQCGFGVWEGQPPECQPSVQKGAISTAKESRNESVAVESLIPTSIPLQPQECFCTYDYENDYLAAYWKDSEIGRDDKIKKGEKVLFNCRYPNMDIVWPSGLRFLERFELICDACEDWKVHDLPRCEIRHSGDSYISTDNRMKILPGGIIEVPKSERISLICYSPRLQPRWDAAPTKKIVFQENPVPVSQTGTFREDIVIYEMDYEHVGKYECFAMYQNVKQRSVVIDLKMSGSVVVCPELPTETDQGSFEVDYTNERKVNSIARYTCRNPLKKVAGSRERRCLESGKWSDSDPACRDIRCPLLNGKGDFLITYNNNQRIVNTMAFYYCTNVQQRLIGSSNRSCLHSGEWSGTNPVCEDFTCNEFPRYNGLSVTYSSGTKVGSIARFSCLNHATLIGSGSSRCRRNGTWSQPKPSCEMSEIHCPKIRGKGIFTIKYSNDRRVNSTAQFFCKARDQKVSGCNFVTCQQNGEWSGDFPTCVDYVTCDPFPDMPNLKVFYNDASGRVGSIAQFQCLPPTSLVGSPSANCLATGIWSHSSPICATPNCSIHNLAMSLPESVHPNMQNVASEFVTPGSELPLECEESLVLTGPSNALCNHHGKWEFSDVQCIPACRVNREETSTLIVEPVKDYYRFGEFILLKCPFGQKLTSEIVKIMCLGGTWSDVLPDCTEQRGPNVSRLTQTTVNTG